MVALHCQFRFAQADGDDEDGLSRGKSLRVSSRISRRLWVRRQARPILGGDGRGSSPLRILCTLSRLSILLEENLEVSFPPQRVWPK
jgi:hypothetical protein